MNNYFLKHSITG